MVAKLNQLPSFLPLFIKDLPDDFSRFFRSIMKEAFSFIIALKRGHRDDLTPRQILHPVTSNLILPFLHSQSPFFPVVCPLG